MRVRRSFRHIRNGSLASVRFAVASETTHALSFRERRRRLHMTSYVLDLRHDRRQCARRVFAAIRHGLTILRQSLYCLRAPGSPGCEYLPVVCLELSCHRRAMPCVWARSTLRLSRLCRRLPVMPMRFRPIVLARAMRLWRRRSSRRRRMRLSPVDRSCLPHRRPARRHGAARATA